MPVHPLACVSYSKLQEGWPRDLTLVPNESLQLYDAMNKGNFSRGLFWGTYLFRSCW